MKILIKQIFILSLSKLFIIFIRFTGKRERERESRQRKREGETGKPVGNIKTPPLRVPFAEMHPLPPP
ncbi:hypothetical protein HanIR_Chr04g0190411 [Helianthus annuus]|nr:hypothetical protein HanIR_Chr04g0190411 [Helianthus annuus]